MRSFGIGFVIAILALIILLANSLYIVTDKQTAILLRFGEIIDPKICLLYTSPSPRDGW